MIVMVAAAYLSGARQARLSALAAPEASAVHKARARFWLAMARQARPPPLP